MHCHFFHCTKMVKNQLNFIWHRRLILVFLPLLFVVFWGCKILFKCWSRKWKVVVWTWYPWIICWSLLHIVQISNNMYVLTWSVMSPESVFFSSFCFFQIVLPIKSHFKFYKDYVWLHVIVLKWYILLALTFLTFFFSPLDPDFLLFY